MKLFTENSRGGSCELKKTRVPFNGIKREQIDKWGRRHGTRIGLKVPKGSWNENIPLLFNISMLCLVHQELLCGTRFDASKQQSLGSSSTRKEQSQVFKKIELLHRSRHRRYQLNQRKRWPELILRNKVVINIYSINYYKIVRNKLFALSIWKKNST